MKISLSLIKEFLNFNLSLKEIEQHFTMAGIEIEGIINETPSFENVVSVKVLEVKRHPKSEKLVIASVTDGKKNYQVVCGAENCKKGLFTALAKENGFITFENKQIFIKKTKLLDIDSEGMLLSSRELNFSNDHTGIIELDENFELGIDLKVLNEPILEISLTPNLGHLLSAYGLAKELGAIINKKAFLKPLKLKETKETVDQLFDVKISDERSKRYSLRILKNIKVKKSPYSIRKQLEAAGFRSINNVVDAINLTMLKLGHPMHAFDLDKLQGNTIKVSFLKQDIEMLCLDDENRKIKKNTLVIEDSKNVLAIAGIIGSKDSSVDESTKNIVIEAAYFDPSAIRKTSKDLSLKTESSIRFEKGIDPNMIPYAIDYAANLIYEITNCEILSNKIDKMTEKFLPKKIKLRVTRVEEILGKHISLNEITNIFERLAFQIMSATEEEVIVSIPTNRNDINIEIDLIEEIARIFGYNNLRYEKAFYQNSKITNSDLYIFEKSLKHHFRQCSMQEILTCDLIGPDLAEKSSLLNISNDSLVHVKHYKSIDQSILRPSLLPSFLEAAKYNFDHKNFDLPFFEISKTHFKNDNKIIEIWTLGLLLSGKKRPHYFDQNNLDLDFFDLKGILENFFETVLTKKYKFKKSNYEALHPHRQANIFLDSDDIAYIGEVHPNLLKSFDIKKRIYFAEINLSKIFNFRKTNLKYEEISLFPGSERDLTISIDKKIEMSKIFDILNKISSPILNRYELLDIFEAKSETKNITLRFFYQDNLKTLLNEEIDKEHLKIVSNIENQLKK